MEFIEGNTLMKSERRHISRSIHSSINITAKAGVIWENITNVNLEEYSDPILFKALGIPKPLKADIISTGVGGERIAFFNSGKRFVQRITTWKPFQEYSFHFNPEKGFMVGHFFD